MRVHMKQNYLERNQHLKTYLAEPGPLLPKQGSLRNAAGVHGAEGNAGTIVISSMQFRYSHHVANFGILVCLGTEEGLTVCHGDGVFHTFFESFHISKVCLGVDKSATCDRDMMKEVIV